MGRKSKAQRDAEIHALALQQFDESFLASQVHRENALMSREFVNIRGAQWAWDTNNDFENRMRLEIDHISGAITRIKNEYRKSRIEAKFIPADGTDADALSDAAASRYRADTCDARGMEARAMAFDSAVEGGYGGLRLRAEYEGNTEYQRVCLEPINDAESCLFFDANAKLKDKSDAEHGFLITPWTRRAFVAKYKEECASWPEALMGQYKFPWFGNGTDLVYVCEYFLKEERTDRYRIFENAAIKEKQEFLEDEITPEDEELLTATGFVEIDGREEEVDQVRKFVMNGAKILKDGEIIPGRCIPLIPQYGHRTVINHVEVVRGHVLKSIDPQIVYNLEVSHVAETAAASGVETPIFLDEQVNPYLTEWQDAHITRPAVMRIAPIRDASGNIMPGGPVDYTRNPNVAPAVAALVSLTKQDISDQMGNPENGEQVQPDLSGIAMDLVQGRIDMQSYGYMDNAADAERRIAEIWQGMAAEIYVEEGRKLKTMSPDGARGSVEIGKMILDKKTGKQVPEVDFAKVPFDVEVEVGPISASRRSAVVRTVTGIMGATPDPEMQTVLAHVALQNLEGEGMGNLREWSRAKLVAMGVEKPTKEEEAEMAAASQQPPPPDPQAMLADALAMEAKAKAMKADADTMLAKARTKESEAKAAETLAGIPLAQQEQALKTAQAIADDMKAEPQQPMGFPNA